MEKKGMSEEKMVLHHAVELSKVITKYIGDRPHLHAYGITTMAYAVEMLLSLPFNGDEKGFDAESEEFRKFLSIVHDDVKKLARLTQTAAN